MPTAIPRASRSPPPRWPPSPSNAVRSTASGTTPSHPTSSRHEALIPRQILILANIPQLLRQVLETTTVNLASSMQQSAGITNESELTLPPTFFLNTVALLDTLGLAPDIAPIRVPGRLYRAALARYDFALSDGTSRVPG